MNKMQVVISIAFLAFSIVLFALSWMLLAKKALFKKYACVAALFYISGTVLIFVVYLFRHDLPLRWTIISEVLVFLVYGLTMANIMFIVKRFERSAGEHFAKKDENNETETNHSDDIAIDDNNK